MWLINTQSCELEEFISSSKRGPSYAILSHTWDAGEVTFEDMKSPEAARQKKGWTKIEQTCLLALEHNLNYAWVDTCCINKDSSSELTEAINSMFQWYLDATICFAHLADLPPEPESGSWPDLGSCRWFSRGWTLQELVASRSLIFYDREWNWRTTKHRAKETISAITRIEIHALEDNTIMSTIPVGRRMSWASQRETTRDEDMAYCLLGIFNVNMPLLYGEGGKTAFIRLQHEIIRATNDRSIFAWRAKDDTVNTRGIFADEPAEFVDCWHLGATSARHFLGEFSLTNNGLKFSTHLVQVDTDTDLELRPSVLRLHCMDMQHKSSETYGIFLRHYGPNLFVRVLPHRLCVLSQDEEHAEEMWRMAPRYISTSPFRSAVYASRVEAIRLRIPRWLQRCADDVIFHPSSLWDKHNELFLTSGADTFHAKLMFTLPERLLGRILHLEIHIDKTRPVRRTADEKKGFEVSCAIKAKHRARMSYQVYYYDDLGEPAIVNETDERPRYQFSCKREFGTLGSEDENWDICTVTLEIKEMTTGLVFANRSGVEAVGEQREVTCTDWPSMLE